MWGSVYTDCVTYYMNRWTVDTIGYETCGDDELKIERIHVCSVIILKATSAFSCDHGLHKFPF